MATTQEAIARLRMIFETQGADAAVAEMKKLETAETSLGTSSLNLDRSFANLERRYSETARATAEYERAMRTLNAAVAQNPALAERAAAVQQTIAARYQATMQAAHQAAQAQTAYGLASQQAMALSSTLANSTGLLGATFQTLGKGGVAAAVGIGGLYLAYQKLDEGVTKTAQYARDTQHFAEATGLTTAQVQGLNKEAARFGISADELHTGLLRFTSGFEEARDGAGSMLEMIRKISPELGQQALTAANEQEALNVVTEALRRATNEFDRARLARAAFGRQGIGLLPMMQQLDIGAVTERYQSRGLGQEQIDQLERLQAEVDAMQTSLQTKVFGAIGTKFLEAKKWGLEVDEAIIKWFGSLISGSKEGQESLEQLYDTQARLLKQIQEMQDQSENYRGSKLEQEWAAQIQRKVDELKKIENQITTKLGQRAPAGTVTTTGQVTPQAQLTQLQALNGILGNLASVEDQVAQKALEIARAYDKVGTEGQAKIDALRNSLLALRQAQAELSQVAPGTYERQLEQIKAIKAEYPGLVAQDAIRMSHLQDQLRIAEAMPGVMRMEAEEQARINQLLLEGKDRQQAIAIASRERAVAQAQINSAAALHLQQLQAEYGVASAITGVQRMQAQQQATYLQLVQQGVAAELAAQIAKQQTANAQAQINANAQRTLQSMRDQLPIVSAVTAAERMKAEAAAKFAENVREGVDEELAQAIAAQQVENAIAGANAKVEQQIHSLNQSTQLIRAQTADMIAQSGEAQHFLGIREITVRTQAAYNNALDEGADKEHALALAAATLNNLLAQRRMQLAQIDEAEARAARQQQQAAAQEFMAWEQQGAQERIASNQRNVAAAAASWGQYADAINAAAQAGSNTARTFNTMLTQMGTAWSQTVDAAAILRKAQQEVALQPAVQREQQAQDQLKQLRDQYRLGGAATDQERAQIQAELTYQQLIKDGVRSDLARQIADQELANRMQELAKSVDENTSALQAQLDPIYTEGRAALRIGYYGEGSGGTMRTVTGTGFGTPMPSNMNVPSIPSEVAGTPGGGTSVVINNNFAPGAVMGDRRTQYQAANSYGRAIQAMG
jgi:hypothetical protein